MDLYNAALEYCPDDAEASGDSFSNVSTLELAYQFGFVEPNTRKPATPRQCPIKRAALIDQADVALVALSEAQAQAGATALARIDEARRISNAPDVRRDRKTMARICAGQRAGLIRALRVLEQQDHIFEMNDRVRKTVDFVLDLSANLSVLSESGWPEAHLWLERTLPIITHKHGDWLESRFKIHLRAAEATLARQVPIRLSDYRTAASPRDIAHSIGVTTHVLRVAKANKCGLTSIDPEPKKERDRRNAEKLRRDRGAKPQSTCTKTADDKQLAVELGCGASTIRRHRKSGTLTAFIEKRRGEQLSSRC